MDGGVQWAVVNADLGQIFLDRSQAIVTSAAAYAAADVADAAALVQVFVPAEPVVQRLTWLEPFAGMDCEGKLAAAAREVQKCAGEGVMAVAGVMGQGMIVVAGQSLQLEKSIVGFDEDLAVQSLTAEAVVESRNCRLDSYMAVLRQETVANYSLEILDMDKVLEGDLVVAVQEPSAAVLTCTDSAEEFW